MADPVSDVFADEGIAEALHIFLNGMGDIRDAVAGFGVLDALEEALAGDLDQPLCLVGDLARCERAAAVALPAVFDGADVNADDVAVPNEAFAGDAVDDLVVHRDAGAAGKSAVAEEARLCALTLDELEDLLVDLLRRDPGSNKLVPERARLGSDLAGEAHLLDVPGCFDCDEITHRPRTFRTCAVVSSTVG